MADVEKLIQKEKERLMKLIADAEKSEKSFDDRISTQFDKKHVAIKEFELALEKASKPYDDIIATMEKEREDIQHKRHTMQIRLNMTESRIRAQLAEKLPEFPDGISFKGFLWSKDICSGTIDKVEKKLPNGITLFRNYESHYSKSEEKHSSSESDRVSYFAVKGKDIIGYIFTRKSRHPGDTAEVYCWINAQYLREKEQLSKNEYCSKPTVGFKAWKQMVSELKTFKPIDLDDKKNRKILGSDYNISSEDMKD
ncbi:MAG: hypothetical protein IMZ64_08670 [Bacteroidetes bacterium]|nr:hypothetical protein [Bacteroidota bacterium]